MIGIVLGMTMGTPPLWSPDAQAQTLQVTEPYADPVVGDHAEAINANPAGVSMGERFNLSYTHFKGKRDEIGHGHAFGISTQVI